MRRAAKVDGNHAELVRALRSCGWLFLSLAALGRGVPDGLVFRQGVYHLVEFKRPRGTLTPDQETFFKLWPVMILRTVDDVLELR